MYDHRINKESIEYEADPKHVELLLREWEMETARPVVTPGVAEEKRNMDDVQENEVLDKVKAKEYRRAAARLNCLALDRADLSFATKEISRSMAGPRAGDVVRLKRTIRYLKHAPIIVIKYTVFFFSKNSRIFM